MNMELLWNNFLGKIQERISPLAYDTWFKDTKLYKIEGGIAIIVVPYILHKKHLEENYIDYIEEIFTSITDTNFSFKFMLEDEIKEEDNSVIVDIPESTDTVGVPNQTSSSANLNSEYTFDSLLWVILIGLLLLLREQ